MTAIQPSPRINTLAIISIITAVVFAPLGIALGIAALLQTKKRGERGRGLAIAAIVIGGALIVLSSLSMAFWVGSSPTSYHV
ncbi:DUF4190 domain-containing protein [Gryllotalpicola koreensis]|uniref:DUF4190 domain-containing protein n=1 Tax=Gryllotalpicola koreensis TaxID=993086 RepID=A0ABP7ZPI7_9MICO